MGQKTHNQLTINDMGLCSTHLLQLEKVFYTLRNRQKYNQDRTTLILAPPNIERMDKAADLIREAMDILEQID